MTSTEVREQAARLIEKQGWYHAVPTIAQDPTRFVEGGPVCLVESIAMATDGPAIHVLTQLREELGIQNLACWNDHPLRTEAQVLAALRGES